MQAKKITKLQNQTNFQLSQVLTKSDQVPAGSGPESCQVLIRKTPSYWVDPVRGQVKKVNGLTRQLL